MPKAKKHIWIYPLITAVFLVLTFKVIGRIDEKLIVPFLCLGMVIAMVIDTEINKRKRKIKILIYGVLALIILVANWLNYIAYS
ncbi:hypothetical protein [Oceanobacillus sp. CAU 1775]